MNVKFWITDAQFDRLKADGKVRQTASREAIFFQGHEETQFGIIQTGKHNIVEPGHAATNRDLGIDEPGTLTLPGTILPARAGPTHPAWGWSGHAASTYSHSADDDYLLR